MRQSVQFIRGGNRIIRADLHIHSTVKDGCVCIELGSGMQREAAHRFYDREGFRRNH